MKRRNLIVWVGILLFGWSGVLNELSSQGTWKYYTIADGLAHDHVWCINQDQNGNYWFGTKKGLTKFDTHSVWTSYLTEFGNPRLDHEVWVMDLEFDSLDHKWMTAGGDFTAVNQSVGNYVIHFDDTTFTWYQPAAGIVPEQSPVCVGKDSLGTIWIGMRDFYAYAWWFDGESWHPFFVPGTLIYDGVNEIKTDRKKRLFFVHDNGLWMLGRFLLKRTEFPSGRAFYDMACDRQNHIWCTTQTSGIQELVIEGNTWHWTSYSTQDGLLSRQTWAIAVDSANAIWIGTPFGAQRFDRKNWLTFTRENGLIHDEIWDILVDRRGDVWFGTSGGVSVFHDTSHTTAVKSVPTIPTRMPDFRLQNYPNPFNSMTQIFYQLDQPAHTTLKIFNLLGQEILTLAEQNHAPGSYTIRWNGKDTNGLSVPAGIYIVRIAVVNQRERQSQIAHRKLVLLY